MRTTNVFASNYEAYRINKHNLIINQGGQGCFAKGQLIVTSNGNIPIEKIKIGDSIKSFNEKIKQTTFNKVTNIFKYRNNKKIIRVTLKNGNTITATEDHKFYFQGGWVSLKNILYLWNDKMENNSGVQ